MKTFFCFVLILTHCSIYAQIVDDFSDGDFTSNPTWSGTDADYIVNGSNELQLNNTIASISYLTTPHGLVNLDNKEWSFHTRQSFSPSGSNNARIYLTAASADLTTDPDGFYLQLGEAGSGDAVRLFKVVGGTDTELIAGTAGQIASSFAIGIRVVRDNSANWTLYIDDAGGTNYSLAGTTNDGSALLGTHSGFFQEYTMSNSDNFFYDDVYIGDEIIDVAPPTLVSVTATSATQVDVLFNEALDQTTAENTANYTITPALGINTATLDGGNTALVHLDLATALTNGQTYNLATSNIEDLSGNPSVLEDMNFMYLVADVPVPGDIVINEFMCDPAPTVGLNNAEFVELYNRSNKYFDVSNWTISDESGTGTMQQGWLLPGDYIVLCRTSDVDSFAVATGVTSFQGLNNDGDNIVIRSDLGVVLDSITYTDAWYGDATKEDGGYTIERINPNDPCTDISDWAASNDASGGTPGTQNSVYDNTPDVTAPGIDQLVALAPNFVEVYFNEGMDSTSLANANMNISPTLTVQNQYVLTAHPMMMTLQFVENLQESQTYTLELQNVADCWLNSADLIGKFALPATPSAGDVVINEILFNPITGGSDWVEVYNNSDKLIDLYQWELANFDNDTIDNNKVIDVHFLLYPDTYAVITEDSAHVLQNFTSAVPGRFVQSDLPTYSNDEGTVYLIANGIVIDDVTYYDDWHFELLDDDDGKSLERIEPSGTSNDRSNWHTAAEAIGFGTPGMENSQYYPSLSNGDFSYTSETISPDNDGFEDVLQINYEMTEPGFVGTFTIYDDRGRLVATVMNSELLSTSGTIAWKGVTDAGVKASIGTYVGIFEAWDANGGALFAKRKAFVVAGQL